jgi:hypothetical protein
MNVLAAHVGSWAGTNGFRLMPNVITADQATDDAPAGPYPVMVTELASSPGPVGRDLP